MKQHWKRMISLFLTLALLAGFAVPVAHAQPASDGKRLEFVEIDPQTLNVPRLGAVEDVGAELDNEAPAHGLNDRVRVSIVLEAPATLELGYEIQGIAKNEQAMAYRAVLRQQQEELAQRISAEVLDGEALEVKWNITLAGNMISAWVPYGKLEAIRALDGVAAVELEQQYEPLKGSDEDVATPAMVNARDMVGADGPEASKYNGAGRKLAIIDTGLDYEHQSFDADAFLHAVEEDGKLDQLMTAADIPSTGLNGRGVYMNAKIPYAYNYVDENTTVNHTGDTQEEHGSHVSGIATANRYLKQGDQFVSAAETVGVVGEAPDAQIFVMKVFGSGGGAYDSDYMVAIEDAMLLGADSVNLSLGSSAPGITYISTASYRTIFQNLVGKDIVVTISMGNNTSWDSQKQLYADDVNLHTGGSPGTYSNAFTVASIDDTGSKAPFLLFNDSLELRYLEGGGSANNQPMTTAKGSYEFIYVDGPGVDDNNNVGAAGDSFLALGRENVEGKIVLCDRGSSSFFAKANAAMAQGAVAMIIVNNQAGTISMALDGYSYTNPVVSVKQTDGMAVKAVAQQQVINGVTVYTGTIEIGGTDNKTPMAYYEMSSFSSWGVPGTLELKPEITAPGGTVYSLNGYHRAAAGGYAGGHDAYEYMSGTSMAAPQMVGLSALMGQYYADNGLREKTGLPLRTLSQSLLMSTAVPVYEADSQYYYSLLKQGAGLANVNAAVSAKTYILMDENATTSYADGKVKAELGDDPFRAGDYTYSFTLHNFGEQANVYTLRTDLFTQALEQDNTLMSHMTMPLNGEVSYTWELLTEPEIHDVNKDGATDELDGQAILDKLTGLYPEDAEFDAAAADLDGDEAVTSYDAYLLLGMAKAVAEAGDEGNLLPAGGTARVTVHMVLSEDQKAELDALRLGGAYVEGFTYVESATDATHSIPVLGFYGSWTDASMFNASTYAESYYGAPQTSYFTANNANGWYVRYNGSSSNSWYLGNPYVREDSWPEGKLALNNDTVLYQATYTLIRNTNYTGFAVVREGEEPSVIFTSNTSASNVTGAYYNTQATNPSWQSTTVRNVSPNKSVASLGLSEGDRFTFGFYALPEYYAKQENGTATLSAGEFNRLLTSGELGKGAYLGYTVTLDNTAPVIDTENTTKNEDGSLTVTVSDNQYIANLRIMDVSGKNVYASVVPEQTEPGQSFSQTFSFEGVELANAVTIFVGDYAGNETAMMVRIAEGDILIERDVYVPAAAIEEGGEYLIVNSNAVGATNALARNNTSVTRQQLTVNAANADVETPFIKADDVSNTAVWKATASGDGFKLDNDGYYIRRNNASLQIRTTNSNNVWSWNGENNYLTIANGNTVYYLRYYNNTFSINTAVNSVYLFAKSSYTEVFNENKVQSITVTPTAAELFVGEQTQLQVDLQPVTLADKSVAWTSSDETVATVDANGLVTAVGAGTVVVTATAVCDPTASVTANITVLASTPVDASFSAQITDGSGTRFAEVNMNDLSTETLGQSANVYAAGGRDGNLILAMTAAYGLYTVDATTFAETNLFSMNSTYAIADAANFPAWGAAVEGEQYVTDGTTLYVTPGQYVLWITDLEQGSLSGFNLSSWNLGFSALAFAGYYEDEETGTNLAYYAVTRTGDVYLIYIYSPGTVTDGALDVTLSRTNALGSTGVTFSDATALSMAYLPTVNGLAIADNTNQRIYYVDVNGEDYSAKLVGKVSGSTNISTLSGPFDAVPSLLENSDGLLARLPANAEKLSDAVAAMKIEPASEPAGTLNAIRGVTDEQPEGVSDPATVIEVTADEANTTNGLLTLTYDATLSLTKIEVNEKVDYCSVVNETGRYVLAFVDLEGAIDKDEAVVRFYLTGSGEAKIAVEELLKNFEPSEHNVTIGGASTPGPVELEFGEPVWTWSADYAMAIATFTSLDGSEVRSVIAVITSETTPATFEAEGQIVYTATVEFQGETYTDAKTVVLPVLTYTYGEPVFVWNEELTEATAVFTSNEDPNVSFQLPAVVTSETTEPSYEAEGQIVYTATVEFDGKTYTDTKTVLLPKLEHDCPCADFVDMPPFGTPEHEAIDWAFTHGITAGMDATHFGTGKTLTRAQAAVFLWAASGRPEIDEAALENPFNDVPEGTWYTASVKWAYSQGLISGYENGSFRPNNKLSRAEILQILYAMAGRPSVEGIENPYTDVAEGKWYKDAALWAYQAGIEKGSEGIFAQSTRCLRESFVLYLYRFLTGNALAE